MYDLLSDLLDDQYIIYTDLSSNFINLTRKTRAEGTYGEIYMANKVNNNNVYALKKYKVVEKYDYIPFDILKEILILQHLNNLKLDCVVKMYGVIIDNYDIYLVLENLYPIDFISNPYTFITETIEAFTKLHNAGILHNDIKKCNIMCDSDKNIKIIDFGLSEFFGFCPSKYLVENYLCTEEVKAPDFNGHPLYVNGNRKSYGSDIYSLGITLIHFATQNYGYTYYNGLHFINENKIVDDKLVSFYGKENVKILSKMLSRNTLDRYFIEPLKKIDIASVKNIENSFSSEYIIDNPINEQSYIYAIHKTYKKDIVPCITTNVTINMLINIDKLIRLPLYNVDTFVNGVILYRTLFGGNKSAFNMLDIITCLNYYTTIFDATYPDIELLRHHGCPHKLIVNSFKLLEHVDKFQVHPLWIHLYYSFLKYKAYDVCILNHAILCAKLFIICRSEKYDITFYQVAKYSIVTAINKWHPENSVDIQDKLYSVFLEAISKIDKISKAYKLFSGVKLI
jgi:serine/threonine protein kinase